MTRRIILAGGSGFLGQTPASYFQHCGFEIVALTRWPSRTHVAGRPVAWDTQRLGPWQKEIEGATAFFLRTETELVIKSRRVIPGRLIKSGFKFQFPTIAPAFKDLCHLPLSTGGF